MSDSIFEDVSDIGKLLLSPQTVVPGVMRSWAQRQEEQEQARRVGGQYARALETPEGVAMLQRRASFAELRQSLSDTFKVEYERAVENRQQRQYVGVPLGFVPGQYIAKQDPRTGDVVYSLLEWPRSPMEEAARRLANETPQRREQMLRVGGQYAQAFATPAGIQQLERRAMGDDFRTPFLTEDTVETDQSVIEKMARMNLDELNTLKRRLILLDLLDENDAGIFEYIDRTPETYEAFLTLVTKAQENGKNWVSFMEEALANEISFGRTKTRAPRAAQLIRLTSADDLNSIFNQAGLRMVGRQLTDEEREFMVTAYNDMERSFQQRAASGGVLTEPPSAQGFVEQRIPDQLGEEYNIYSMGNVLDSFRAVMAGQL
jgi:hypothetical protein